MSLFLLQKTDLKLFNSIGSRRIMQYMTYLLIYIKMFQYIKSCDMCNLYLHLCTLRYRDRLRSYCGFILDIKFHSFQESYSRLTSRVKTDASSNNKKDMDLLIIFVMLMAWLHRTACVRTPLRGITTSCRVSMCKHIPYHKYTFFFL